MKNLVLFVVTVTGYFGAWWYIGGAPEGASDYALRLGILALLSAPWNINGNIWTIIGNAESEESIFALFSFYQKAENDTLAVFGLLLYQDAGEDAYLVMGVSIWQSAVKDALVFIGSVLWQKASRDTVMFCGVIFWQRAGREALLIAGISLYQGLYPASFRRDNKSVQTVFGFAVYQTVPCGHSIAIKSRVFGTFGKFSVS